MKKRSTDAPSVDERIAAYNATMRELREDLADVTTDPAAFPQLIEPSRIDANGYNPNSVASPEMALLRQSIEADGITMAVVVMPEGARFTTIDGFHRHKVGAESGRRYIPCSVIDRPLADRMASTVRHNRARGKHQVELMASLVKGMLALGWDDHQIATSLGMSVEELLRLKQMVGAARLMASEEYSRTWAVRGSEEP